MDDVNLGEAGLRVSRICLGMMSYEGPESRPWALEGLRPSRSSASPSRAASRSLAPPTSTTGESEKVTDARQSSIISDDAHVPRRWS